MSLKQRAVIWFRNDLRIHDNLLLDRARSLYQNGFEIICLYCFDERNFRTTKFGSLKCNTYRTNFLIQSVENLRNSLNFLNTKLLVAHGMPQNIISQYLTDNSVVITAAEDSYEEKLPEKSVEIEVLKNPSCTFERIPNGSFLYPLVII
jgi:deoxyribodipyrimidine photo-lyase